MPALTLPDPTVAVRNPAEVARLALHESGHAVACVALNRAFRVVQLAPIPDLDAHAAVLGVEPQDRPLGWIVACLAGPIAEHVHADVPLDDVVCGHGYRDVGAVLAHGLHPDALFTLTRVAHRIVGGTHAAAVLAVAAALTRPPHHLTRAEVADLVTATQQTKETRSP